MCMYVCVYVYVHVCTCVYSNMCFYVRIACVQMPCGRVLVCVHVCVNVHVFAVFLYLDSKTSSK